MFDENKYKESDELMRSILSQAEEEVPAHLWEGISSELDRIEAAGTRKTVFLWFRRTAIAAAAAAAVAVGVFTDWNVNGDLVAPSEKNLISVTGTPQIHTGEEHSSDTSMNPCGRIVPYISWMALCTLQLPIMFPFPKIYSRRKSI